MPGINYLLSSFYLHTGNSEKAYRHLSLALNLIKNCSLNLKIFFPSNFSQGRLKNFLKKIVLDLIFNNYIPENEKFLPFLPERPAKPRNSGITMVMDKGLSIREAEDFMSVGSEYTDFVKLGFGTSLITPGFEKKISIYKKAGVIPYFGGTLFEAFIIRNMFKEFIEFLDKHEIELVEVSDGSYDIEHKRKLEYISRLAERGTVISEVGSKKEVVYSPENGLQ